MAASDLRSGGANVAAAVGGLLERHAVREAALRAQVVERPSDQARRAAALAMLNRRILLDYSARTSRALGRAMPLRIAIPHIEAVLASQVKEWKFSRSERDAAG